MYCVDDYVNMVVDAVNSGRATLFGVDGCYHLPKYGCVDCGDYDKNGRMVGFDIDCDVYNTSDYLDGLTSRPSDCDNVKLLFAYKMDY